MEFKKIIKENKIDEFFLLFKNKYFYISLLVFFIGVALNYLSQSYLNKYISSGNSLPVLSDIILDNIPYYNVSWVYDWFVLLSAFIFIIYIVNKKEYKKIPFYILLYGIFFILRGIFVVLTPLGNPPNFNGTKDMFHGFTKYELGVYPSGHTGSVFLYALFSKGIYRWILSFFCVIVILSLFFYRGHYSIDILSGIIFAYAIYCFGNKYFRRFKGENN